MQHQAPLKKLTTKNAEHLREALKTAMDRVEVRWDDPLAVSQDSAPAVRVTLAAGLHEVCILLFDHHQEEDADPAEAEEK